MWLPTIPPEGNQLGPTLSFRGIDMSSYYRLVGDDPRYYMDYTGCATPWTATIMCVAIDDG